MAVVDARPGRHDPVGEPEPEPRSLLIISLDTVRADYLSVYGGEFPTPSLERLAEEGVTFESALSHFPETAVSHWVMMTGVEPDVHGPVPEQGTSRYLGPTLAEITKKHGYQSAAFIGGMTLTATSSGLQKGFGTYDDHYDWFRSDLKRPGGEVVERARQWIQSQSGPWFAFVHLFDAHTPYQPPAPWTPAEPAGYQGLDGSESSLRPILEGQRQPSEAEVKYARALYGGELQYLDSLLPSLLEAAGSEAVVIVSSDHGESFEHDYYFNHREGLWDSVLRIPLLVRAPGLEGGQRVEEQVSLSDLAPTALDLMGLPLDRKMSGQALLSDSDFSPRAHLARTDARLPSAAYALRTQSRKRIERLSGEFEVFDLLRDPEELSPLEDAAEVLRAALESARAQLTDSMRTLQGPPLPSRHQGKQEQKQLEALGYQEPPSER